MDQSERTGLCCQAGQIDSCAHRTKGVCWCFAVLLPPGILAMYIPPSADTTAARDRIQCAVSTQHPDAFLSLWGLQSSPSLCFSPPTSRNTWAVARERKKVFTCWMQTLEMHPPSHPRRVQITTSSVCSLLTRWCYNCRSPEHPTSWSPWRRSYSSTTRLQKKVEEVFLNKYLTAFIIHINSTLDWSSHTTAITKKHQSRLSLLRRLGSTAVHPGKQGPFLDILNYHGGLSSVLHPHVLGKWSQGREPEEIGQT